METIAVKEEVTPTPHRATRQHQEAQEAGAEENAGRSLPPGFRGKEQMRQGKQAQDWLSLAVWHLALGDEGSGPECESP